MLISRITLRQRCAVPAARSLWKRTSGQISGIGAHLRIQNTTKPFSIQGNQSNNGRWRQWYGGQGGARRPLGPFLATGAAAAGTALLVPKRQLDEVDKGQELKKTRERLMYEASMKEEQEMRDTIGGRVHPIVAFVRDWIWEPVTTALRFVHLTIIFLPVLVTMPLVLIGPVKMHKANERWGALVWYKYLTWTMEAAGPSFIKLGQWAASRQDIFPEALCEEMSKLHSNAKQHSLAQTKRIVCRAFGGRHWDDIFEEFIETPLGVGAMGQVYKAKLRRDLKATDDDTGTGDLVRQSKSLMDKLERLQPRDVDPPTDWVVIKVLHPRVRSVVKRDLKIMRFLAKVVDSIPTMEWLSLPDEVDTFGRMMRLQLDLRIEAENLLVFRNNFHDTKDITFPRPYTSFTSRDVLVEEFISGIPMGQLLQYTRNSRLDKEVAEKGLDSFLKMLLLDNFIHSDLHPGNIVVRLYKKGTLDVLRREEHVTSEDVERITKQVLSLDRNADVWNKELDALYEKGYRPQVCYIDTGLVTELDERNRRNFIDLFKAISAFDGYRVGELMVERSRTPDTAVEPEVFALKVQRLVQHIKSRTFALGSVKLGDLLGRMLSMVRQHHVRMEGDFVTVVLSILLLEGIGRQLEPDIDLFKSSIPILRQLGPTHPHDFSFGDDTLSMLKVWLVLEVRQFINASIQDIHNIVKYDQLSPNE